MSGDGSGFTSDLRNDRTIDLVFVLDLVEEFNTAKIRTVLEKDRRLVIRVASTEKISTLHFQRRTCNYSYRVVRYAASYAIIVACSSERI